jgi:hypothetical protein
MTHVRNLCLCLLAVLAASAVGATSAGAECIGCRTQMSSSEVGPFAISGGPYELSEGKVKVLHCEQTQGSSTFADGSGFNGITLTGTGCASGMTPCNSAGKATGEVSFSTFTRTIGYINGKAGIVGVEDLPNNSEDVIAQFTCGANQLLLKGGVVGTITPPSVLVASPNHFTVTFAQSAGKQAVKNLEGQGMLSLTLSENGGEAKAAALASTESMTPTHPTEIIRIGPLPQTPPEYGRCRKATPKNFGEYSDSACRTPTAPGTGKFEWLPAPHGPNFKGGHTGKGAATTLQAGAVTVSCLASTSAGEVTAPKAGTDQITFTGCEEGKVKCASGGDPQDPGNGMEVPGTIVTKPLATALVEPTQGTALTQLTAVGGGEGLAATFHCGGQIYELAGLASGLISPLNLMALKTTASFSGEQTLKLLVFNGTSFEEVPGTTTLTSAITDLNAEKLEVKTK